MAVRIKFDNTHNVIQPTFVLATRGGYKLGVVPATNISVSDSFNSGFELEFQVDKMDNGKEYHLWDKLTDFKLIWCREWNVWFEIYVSIDDEDGTKKNVSCVSLGEAELSQVNLYNVEINTEDDIARDDYSPTVLYNAEKPEASLLNRIMEKAPHYSIKYVDSSIANIQRTFSFDNTTIYDAFQDIAEEIDCLFVIDSGTNEDGEISRSVSVYDLESSCSDCGHRGNFTGSCPECGSQNISTGYGEDTTIFVSTENLADNITFETDTDSVKNCFRLEAGDDLMTATVRICNLNGSQYLWYISDEARADMSDELSAKLAEYDDLYDYYQGAPYDIAGNALIGYNELIEKYKKYKEDLHTLPVTAIGYAYLMTIYYDTIDFYLFLHDSLMPSSSMSDTSAKEQAAKLTASALSPVAVQDISTCSVSTASSAVLSVAKTIIDSRYQIKVKNSAFENGVWTGNFTVTNYSDEEDTAESAEISITINDDYETFIRQKIEKALKNTQGETESANDIIALFKLSLDDFKAEIQKYCLTSLNSFYDACQTCLDIMIEQGVADRETWATNDPDLYTELYLNYYNKLDALSKEVLTREKEISIIEAMQEDIDAEKNKAQTALDMEAFLGTDLWIEFISYRREDTYSNDNYISDGLDNGELFENALEFLEVAKNEIYKSATLQHSLTASLKNLLVMKEFAPIVDKFAVGNWIRVKVNDEIYRLRLISYSIDFENLNNISVEFSDVKQCADGITDTESIINQAKSMASSYSAVTRQASQGNKSKQQVDDWVTQGLSLTNMKIVGNADNQNITWDSHGLLCREYLPITDSYSEKQLKVINRGLYLTDDNWLTSKAGIGDFTFYNPGTEQMEESYGVVADTLVGNLILSEKVGIYNTLGSITLDDGGLTITADVTDTTSEESDIATVTIQRKELDENGETIITPLLYMDADGNLVMSGSMHIQSNADKELETLNDLCDKSRFDDKISTSITNATTEVYNTIEEKYITVMSEVNTQIEDYKADVGQYIQFNDNGLTLGATGSDFKTVIDNKGLYFKESDTTVAYINNNMLYIPNAVIEQTLILGKFIFSPREDGGVSLVWNSN